MKPYKSRRDLRIEKPRLICKELLKQRPEIFDKYLPKIINHDSAGKKQALMSMPKRSKRPNCKSVLGRALSKFCYVGPRIVPPFSIKIRRVSTLVSQKNLTDGQIIDSAKPYQEIMICGKNCRTMYTYAQKRGILHKCTNHMIRKMQRRSEHELLEKAKTCMSVKEMKTRYPKEYTVIASRGSQFYKKATSHFVRAKYTAGNRKVKCIELNRIFDSAAQAGLILGFDGNLITQSIKRGHTCE